MYTRLFDLDITVRIQLCLTVLISVLVVKTKFAHVRQLCKAYGVIGLIWHLCVDVLSSCFQDLSLLLQYSRA